jgi:serine/threonine protein kinase
MIHYRSGSKKPVALVEKLRVLAEVVQGLTALHHAGIVHADLKPDNILFSNTHPVHIRLADFGLSVFNKAEENDIGASEIIKTNDRRGVIDFAPYRVSRFTVF